MTALVFVWDYFGPGHADRCEAVASLLGSHGRVVGIELYASTDEYGWDRGEGDGFEKITLFPGERRGRLGVLRLACAIVATARRARARAVFLCHYQERAILLAACMLRLLGVRVITMGDSKFDDKPRRLMHELGKRLFIFPYQGGLTASERGRDYLRLLGLPGAAIELGYDNVSVARLERAAHTAIGDDVPWAKRPFVCVARLVPKKRHDLLLSAYGEYVARVDAPRELVLCGSGPLEAALRNQAIALGLGELVRFKGWLQTDEIARVIKRSIALILPSVEEQFGIAIIEALSLGVPVIASESAGARDLFVRSGVNGFVLDGDNADGLSFFMQLIGEDLARWTHFSTGARAMADLADVAVFARSAARLARHPADNKRSERSSS